MLHHVRELLGSKKVLLLQGPMGNFFLRFSNWLQQQHIDCLKVNFNGGDWFFSKKNKQCYNYTDTLENFDSWLDVFINEHDIDAIVCFGDCRFYHKVAKQVSLRCDVKFFAFEEGYIRPDFITFEQNGVNFFSNFSDVFIAGHLDRSNVKNIHVNKVDNRFSSIVYSAILYYFFWTILGFKYPNYQHHRQITPILELYYWSRSSLRRVKNYIFEKRYFKRFLLKHSKTYFIFALQVHNDSQIHTHSDLKCVELYIEKVIASFAQYAEKDHQLVLKHHPMDRGYRNYSKLIARCALKYKVDGRLHYFCDIHFPSLLKHSLGMVTVNSTTGLQALHHNIPVKALGYAIYNLPGLTNQYPLQQFWKRPGMVDAQYFTNFKVRLIEYSQLNGSFYGTSPWMDDFNKMNIDD